MSDTSTTDTTDTTPASGSGVLAFRPSEMITTFEPTDPAIDDGEARKLVASRLVELGLSQSSARGFSYAIVDGLPPDVLYASVVNQIDLRPFLQQIGDLATAAQTEAATNPNNYWEKPANRFINQVQDHIDELDDAGQNDIAEDATAALAVAQESIRAAYAQTGVAPPPEALQFTYEIGFDPGARILQASASIASGEASVETASAWSVGASDDLFTQYVNEPVVSIGSIRAQFEAARSDAQAQSAITGQPVVPTFGTINQADSANLEANGGTGQVFPVAIESSSPTSIPESMPINQALLFLSRQTPEDVLAVQQQLAAAGYFDVLGATFTPKDRYDDATLAAWRMAVADSIVQNKPVMTVLADAKARRDATVTQRKVEARQAVSATDTGYMLDSWAQETLGRTLSAVEKQSLTAYVRNLAGDASQMSYGTNTEAEMATVAEAGYDQGALQDRLMETTFAERTSDQAMNLRQHMMSKYELQDYIPEGGIDAGS